MFCLVYQKSSCELVRNSTLDAHSDPSPPSSRERSSVNITKAEGHQKMKNSFYVYTMAFYKLSSQVHLIIAEQSELQRVQRYQR